MRKEFTSDTTQSTLTMGMQQESEQKSYPTSISSLEDFLASLSQLQGIGKDSMTQEELCFLKSQGFCETKNQGIFYSKMLGIYYLMTRETLSRQLLGFSPNWGILYRGRYVIAEIMESHRTENEYTLSDVLERNVDSKYYLSEETTRKRMTEE